MIVDIGWFYECNWIVYEIGNRTIVCRSILKATMPQSMQSINAPKIKKICQQKPPLRRTIIWIAASPVICFAAIIVFSDLVNAMPIGVAL